LPLIMMFFGKGALTDEQKAEPPRKIMDLVVKETGPQENTLGASRGGPYSLEKPNQLMSKVYY